MPSPSSAANAYSTWIAGVVTCSAFDPSGQLAPGPGGPAGRVQQTTSPFASSASVAQSAFAGRAMPLSVSRSLTVSSAAAPPSATSRDAPARAAASAAVCAEVRAAQFSPISTTSAANPSSTVMASATVTATLPRSEPPDSTT